jgi:hypothetical protein
MMQTQLSALMRVFASFRLDEALALPILKGCETCRAVKHFGPTCGGHNQRPQRRVSWTPAVREPQPNKIWNESARKAEKSRPSVIANNLLGSFQEWKTCGLNSEFPAMFQAADLTAHEIVPMKWYHESQSFAALPALNISELCIDWRMNSVQVALLT